MYGMRGINLLAVAIVVASLLLSGSRAALAQAPAAPGLMPGAAPCYAAIREDLGSVVPSNWHADASQAVCAQAAASLAKAGLALPPAAPIPASGAAPCYAAMRQDLGTVVPSAWRGYANEAACRQTVKDQAAAARQAIANVVAKVDLSACYRALRQDLGAVLPGHDSSFLAGACTAATQASAR